MPFFLKMRVNSFEISSSSIGRSCGITSTMVVFVPKREKIDANSQPTAPAPMTSIDFGMRSSSRMWSELMMRLPSALMCGRSFGTEPMARMMFFVLSVCLPSTSTVLRSDDLAEAGDALDLVLLEEELDALGVVVDDALLALLDVGPVDGRRRRR